MTERRLEVLVDGVFRELGFAPTELLRQRLGRVIRHRMRAVGAVDLNAYLDHLETAGRDELTRLAQALTINETYFFREPKHFAALEQLLAEQATRVRPIRLLSAGCASGEEAYSMAISAWQVLGDPEAFEVIGVDVDESALRRARDGLYGRWSLREDGLDRAGKFLRPKGDRWQVIPELQSCVHFERMNLVESVPRGPFHVIFCRNMLMYLTPENRRAVVEKLAQELSDGGAFFIGSAESLEWWPSDLKRVRAYGTFFYRKQSQPVQGAVKAARRAAGRVVLVSSSPLVRMLWRQTVRSFGVEDALILPDWRTLHRTVGEHGAEAVVVDAPVGEEGPIATLLDRIAGPCRRIMLVRPGSGFHNRYQGLEVVTPGSASPVDFQAWLENLLAGQVSPAAPVTSRGVSPGGRRAERLLLIGCSTGGPPAVAEIMSALPAGLGLAVIIVQHMPVGFTRAFAERLDRVSAYRVQEAAEGAELLADAALVAPGQNHLLLGRRGLVKVVPSEPTDIYVPGIDRTFLSVAASSFADRTFAVILTGMGNDGAAGLRALAAAGAETAVQDPVEALIPAMVNAALDSARQVLRVRDIPQAVAAWAKTRPHYGGGS